MEVGPKKTSVSESRRGRPRKSRRGTGGVETTTLRQASQERGKGTLRNREEFRGRPRRCGEHGIPSSECYQGARSRGKELVVAIVNRRRENCCHRYGKAYKSSAEKGRRGKKKEIAPNWGVNGRNERWMSEKTVLFQEIRPRGVRKWKKKKKNVDLTLIGVGYGAIK